MQLDAENIDALNSAANCHKHICVKQGIDHYEQCASLYQRALDVDPEDFESNFNFGLLLYERKKDSSRAIHYLKLAIQQEANPVAMFNLGIIYEEQGERELAKEMYEEVLKVRPDHYKARVNLGIILEKEGQSKSANKHYHDALKMRPNEAKIHHNMGINLKRAGKL